MSLADRPRLALDEGVRFPVLLTLLASPCTAADTTLVSDPPLAKLSTRHRVETVASGLSVPWDLAFLPNGDALFTERPGRVRMIRNGSLLPRPLLEVPAVQQNKSGLLGIVADPDFTKSKEIFLAWNRARGNEMELIVQRYRLDQDRLIDPFPLIEGIPGAPNHTGCRLVFGPKDGLLYFSTGDADKPPLAQRLNSAAGKILRIRKDGSIPADNPFTKRKDAHPAVFSYGHRNPQGLAFHPSTGQLLASEHGPLHGDELNAIRAGGNYGWPLISHRKTAPGMIPPLIEFSPACAPGPLLFPTGTMFPELRGTLLMATLRDQSVWHFALDGDGPPHSPTRLFHKRFGRIRFLVEAPDGALWLSTSMHDPPEGRPGTSDDRILRIVADPQGHGSAPDVPTLVTPTPAASVPGNAPARYAAYCAACHGTDFRGNTAPSLRDKPWRRGETEEAVSQSILNGIPGTGMPAAKHLLNPIQAADLARWLLKQTGRGLSPHPHQ